MNVDGAFDKNKAGIGAVVRDGKGEIIAAMATPIQNIHEAEHLEAIAIAQGIEFANDLSLTGFCIESDCKNAVRKVNQHKMRIYAPLDTSSA